MDGQNEGEPVLMVCMVPCIYLYVGVYVDTRMCLIENSGGLNQPNRLVVTALLVCLVCSPAME